MPDLFELTLNSDLHIDNAGWFPREFNVCFSHVSREITEKQTERRWSVMLGAVWATARKEMFVVSVFQAVISPSFSICSTAGPQLPPANLTRRELSCVFKLTDQSEASQYAGSLF